jgi:hypothetical protein
MQEEFQYKVDGQLITIPTGKAAGSMTEAQISVDESFDEIIGIEAHEVANGGSPYYRIGFKDKDKGYLELVHKNSILTDETVPQGSKMRAINAPISNGRKYTVQVYNDLVLGTDLRFEIVFTLRRKVIATR